MYADKIKKIREKLDLSVAKMADKMEVPQRTFTAYERNERTPSLDFLARLCKIYNVNCQWFLLDEGEMFNAPKYKDVKDELKTQVLSILKEQGLI